MTVVPSCNVNNVIESSEANSLTSASCAIFNTPTLFNFSLSLSDKYFFEIDANLYGITKSKKYLEKDYPELYVKIKEELDKKERIYKYDYMMYDASNTVDMFLKCSKIISKIKQATSISKLGFEKIEKSPVLDIFLNEDSSFKNIKEIIKSGDLILLKASNSMNFSKILNELKEI